MKDYKKSLQRKVKQVNSSLAISDRVYARAQNKKNRKAVLSQRRTLLVLQLELGDSKDE